jgi:hypothetical protein
MKRGIARIALVVAVALGILIVSAVAVTANEETLTKPLFPSDQPGPHIGFWLTQMPKLVYVDGEKFLLRFTAIPLTGAVQVWDFDLSTFMTLGSRYEGGESFTPEQTSSLSAVLLNHGIRHDPTNPAATLQKIWRSLSESEQSELIQDLKSFGFRYEPWESALEMLQGFWTESGLCDGLLGLVGGPGSSMLLHYPCLNPRPSMEVLVEHGPAGWYEFTQGLQETLGIAVQYAEQGYPVEVFVVNRGPFMDADRDRIPEMIDLATAYGIHINVVPMGNEPGPRTRFPYLKPLRELAEATGGTVYYQPNLQDVYDFSMLGQMVPRMMRDFYGRMGQVDKGVVVAPRASLVLAPSEHVEVLSPSISDVATGAGVRIPFQNLTIGAPQSVDLRLRVSTNVTGTLLPVFRGSTRWADIQYSYFEWSDPLGFPHRVPLPQRVISVTGGTAQSYWPTYTPMPTHTRVPSLTSSPWPTETPVATSTATLPLPLPPAPPVATGTATASPIPTATPTLTWTATATPSATPTRTPTATAIPARTPTMRPTARPTWTPEPTPAWRNDFYLGLIVRGYRGIGVSAPYPAPTVRNPALVRARSKLRYSGRESANPSNPRSCPPSSFTMLIRGSYEAFTEILPEWRYSTK